jgi:putative phosphonate metabolism protein
MEQMKRYAVYYAPRPGDFADKVAGWLGWDAVAGKPAAQPDVPGLPRALADLTAAPRKYGFHGTIRAPFRAAEGVSPQDIRRTVDGLAARMAPVRCQGLRLDSLDGFLALTPEGCEADLHALAAAVVEATNPLRARLSAAERAKRRPDQLSSRQRALLDLWGYPYVMDEFQFHLTLTDRLAVAESRAVRDVLHRVVSPVLPRPFVIEDLCLFGEDEAGRFHLLHRAALSG